MSTLKQSIRDSEQQDYKSSSIAKTDVKAGAIDVTFDIYDYAQEDIVESRYKMYPTLFYNNTTTGFSSLRRLGFKKI